MTSPRFPQRFSAAGSRAGRTPPGDESRTAPPPLAGGDAEVPSSTTACATGETAAEVILFAGSLDQAGSAESAPARARGLFIPENYEPHYAYPLVIWLHEAGRSERDVAEVLPRISSRNYAGLALRGTLERPQPAGDGFDWPRPAEALLDLQDELVAAVRSMRRRVHVHSERIFLGGAGAGADVAWELFLERPEWFAGLAALGGRFPAGPRPLRRFRALAGRRLFVAADARNAAELRRADETARLMYAAGLEVRVRRHASRWRSRRLLRHVDRWIMQSIGGCF
jgi:phospholipase/carboxylesterase